VSIGCCIITYNEEKNIENTLKALSFCDEIVIVDSFSKDSTIDIAKKYTDKIYTQEWLGYGKQKNFAISKMSTDWILSIDADEIVTKQLAQEIPSAINKQDAEAFLINIQLVFMGKALRFGGTYPDYHLRLFKKGLFQFREDSIHERIDSKAKRLKGKIMHYSYENLEDYLEKLNKYTSLIALSHKKNNKKVSNIFPFLRAFYEFNKRFLFKGAFLDGYEGSVYALLSSFYSFTKYAKLIELNRK